MIQSDSAKKQKTGVYALYPCVVVLFHIVKFKMDVSPTSFHPSKSLVELAGRNAAFDPNKDVNKSAHVKSMDEYYRLYRKSLDDPEGFWGDIAKDFYWKESYDGEFMKYNFNVSEGPIEIKFMEGAKTNICYNALDRNVKDKGLEDKIAFYWYVEFLLHLPNPVK